MLACGGVEMGCVLRQGKTGLIGVPAIAGGGRVQVEARVGVAHDVAFHLI